MSPPFRVRRVDVVAEPTVRRHDRFIAILLGITTFVLLVFFYRGFFHGTDEIGVFETTRALYERGSLDTPGGAHVYPGVGGRLYNHFAIGQSILALPLYAAGTVAENSLPATWVTLLAGDDISEGPVRWGGTIQHFFVGLYSPMASGILVGLFFLFERRLRVTPRSAGWSAVLLTSTTYVATMGVYFLRHTTEAVFVLAALYCLWNFRLDRRRTSLAWASFWSSSILLIRVPALLAAPALIGYLGWLLLRRNGPGPGYIVSPGTLAAAGLPFLGVVGIHGAVNHAKWGTLIGSPILDQASGFTTPLYVGLFGLLFSPGASVFVYSPLLLLGFWTLREFWASHRAECATIAGIVLPFLLVCSKFELWSGLWSAPGPRYLFVATPLLMLALGPWLDRSRGRSRWIWCGALGTLGALVQLGLLAARFGTVSYVMRYESFAPSMSFLYLPDRSPVIGSWWLLWQRPQPASWIWQIAIGWPGQDGNPAVAWTLGLLWLLLLGIMVYLLIRAFRNYPEARKDPTSSAEPQSGRSRT